MDKYFLGCYVKAINEEKREIYAIASAPILDRDREIIRWNAWLGGGLDAFLKHPIVLVGHNYSGLWVARVTELQPKKEGLYFRAVFARTAEAEEAWQLIKDTNTAAFSVGFMPIAYEDALVKGLESDERRSALAAGLSDSDRVRVYVKCSLLEISLCAVPSCPSALLIAWKGGKIKTKGLRDALAATEQVLILDDEKRAPVRNRPGEIDIDDPAQLAAFFRSDDFKRLVRRMIRDSIDIARGIVR